MEELLLEIQKKLKEWYKREPKDIALVCIAKSEIKKLNTDIEFALMKDKKLVCPECRFPKRISGGIFITKDTDDYNFIENARCKLCRHVPDYVMLSLNPLQANIIYRNFNGSKDYFEKVKKYLEENNIEVVKS